VLGIPQSSAAARLFKREILPLTDPERASNGLPVFAVRASLFHESDAMNFSFLPPPI
jgi:hypothetical protein